jgi:hypothetical protein
MLRVRAVLRRERSEVLRDSARRNGALVHAVLLLTPRELVECERVGALHGQEAVKAARELVSVWRVCLALVRASLRQDMEGG